MEFLSYQTKPFASRASLILASLATAGYVIVFLSVAFRFMLTLSYFVKSIWWQFAIVEIPTFIIGDVLLFCRFRDAFCGISPKRISSLCLAIAALIAQTSTIYHALKRPRVPSMQELTDRSFESIALISLYLTILITVMEVCRVGLTFIQERSK